MPQNKHQNATLQGTVRTNSTLKCLISLHSTLVFTTWSQQRLLKV